MAVGLSQSRVAVVLSALDERVGLKRLAPQSDLAALVGLVNVAHAAYPVAWVGGVAAVGVGVGREHEAQSHRAVAAGRVGLKCYVVFVELIVAVVVEQRRQPGALVLQFGHREAHAVVQSRRVVQAVHQPLHGRVANHVVHRAYAVGASGVQRVGYVNPAPPLVARGHAHRASEPPLVVQFAGQVVARARRPQRVEHHGRLAHRLQRAVYPFGAVAPCERVGCERNFHHREPSRVAPLRHEALVVGCGQSRLRRVGLHLNVVDEPLPLGHILCDRARRHKAKRGARCGGAYCGFTMHLVMFGLQS